jgi:predicted site-specific integrase-resolvase
VRSFADYFDRARRKRHAAGYERVGVVSEGEADDLIRQVELFQVWVTKEVERLRDRAKA